MGNIVFISEVFRRKTCSTENRVKSNITGGYSMFKFTASIRSNSSYEKSVKVTLVDRCLKAFKQN